MFNYYTYNPPTTWPANKMNGPLLNLPAELRIQIYENVFSGSQVVFKPSTRKDRSRGVRKGQSNAFTTTNQWQLLLTCRQCYYEGRLIFWEETRLHGGDLEDLFIADYLPPAVSDFTRDHVRHLRCISHQSLWRVLEGFPGNNLETIEVHFPPHKAVSAAAFDGLDRPKFFRFILPSILHMAPGNDSAKMWCQWLEKRGISIEGRTCTFLVRLEVKLDMTGRPRSTSDVKVGCDGMNRLLCSGLLLTKSQDVFF